MPRLGDITCDCGECRKCRHRIIARRWYYKNREKALELQRKARAHSVEKIRAKDRERGYRVYDAEKARVRRIVSHAVRDGKLTRQPCEVCGERAQAHHDDYSKPLDVRWLCPTHHGEVHRTEVPL